MVGKRMIHAHACLLKLVLQQAHECMQARKRQRITTLNQLSTKRKLLRYHAESA